MEYIQTIGKNELHIQLITSLVNRQNTNDSIFEKIGYYYTCSIFM